MIVLPIVIASGNDKPIDIRWPTLLLQQLTTCGCVIDPIHLQQPICQLLTDPGDTWGTFILQCKVSWGSWILTGVVEHTLHALQLSNARQGREIRV
jgi:hypothetical protein